MKKILATLFCFLGIYTTYIYSQNAEQITNTTAKSSLLKQLEINSANSSLILAGESKKVFIHYMGWFGNGIDGRHWEDSQPRTPLIGYYDSRSWATQMYHILLSWSCGCDGLVINVKDDFDDQSLRILITTMKRIRDIDSMNLTYNFSISYDDQGMANVETAKEKFRYLKDSILILTQNYLKYEGIPVIFIYNYKDPNPYLSPIDYDTALGAVFPTNRPKVLWNEIEAPEIANSYYPWVQGWAQNGSNWGKSYLDWYYPTIANTAKLDFVTGGVWAGFDDRYCSWGQNRWIDRQNGAIYDSTWNYIKTYSTLYPTSLSPLKWAYIETWNDWNEGSEIEPSVEFGYKYLKSTIKNINAFKDTIISEDTCKFEAAKKIYEAAKKIELKQRDSATYYPCLKSAIKYFILNKCDSAICKATFIICGVPNCCNVTTIIGLKYNGIEIYPNPANDILYIKLPNNIAGIIEIIDIQGKILLNKPVNKQLETIDISSYPKGIYLIKILHGNNLIEKKIIKD